MKIIYPVVVMIAGFALVYLVSLINPNADAVKIGEGFGFFAIFAFIAGWHRDSQAKARSRSE